MPSGKPLTVTGPIAAVALVLTIAPPAAAQDSRESLLAAERAEKATRLRPYEPPPLERRLRTVERALDVYTTATFYPYIGSTFEGGGLAFGPGYRGRYGDTGTINAHAAVSFRNYRTVDASITLPALARGRVSVSLNANWLDAPNVPFYGLASDGPSGERGGFSYGAASLGVSARVQAARHFAVGGGMDWMQLDAAPATATTNVAALDPTYRRTHAFAEVDTRTSPSYSRRGGLYRVEWSDYRQANGSTHSFRRVDADVRQFIPLARENWVIALRALASTTDAAAGQDVPYFFTPELGGHNTLRGYPSWRFRDRNRLLLTGEYRWTAGSFVDMALFVDAGQVASRLRDFDAGEFRKSYGIGASFHTPLSTVMRIELARTSEGNTVLFSIGPSF